MKVLMVEDDPVSRRLLEVFLGEWGYDVVVAGGGVKAWEILQNPGAPSLVISDWMMPDMTGVELCAKVRSMKRTEYTYFILLTSKQDKEDVIKGLEAGADDFIGKPFDQQELKYRMKIGERIIKLERRIQQLANTDALTGLLNRRAFMERIEQELSRSRRENTPLSLILTDIDYFKNINDRYGHQAGDCVLQWFAQRLTQETRPYDMVARYGGEEFTVCLPGVDLVQSVNVAERLCQKIAQMQILLPDCSQSIQITASFGTAALLPENDLSVDRLIKQADDALYKAKDSGRNCVCVMEA